MAEDWRKETRQERRARRQESERARMPKHARRLAEVYRNAIEKRAKEAGEKPTAGKDG